MTCALIHVQAGVWGGTQGLVADSLIEASGTEAFICEISSEI